MANEVRVLIRADDQASKTLDQVAEKAGSGLASAAKIGGAAILGLGAAGITAGLGAFKLGADFDDAFDTIQIGTGATGDTLDGLKQTFRDTFASVPTDMGSAAQAIADLNTRTGATGEFLQGMAMQMLELTRITGGDLSTNIEGVTRLMGDWGIGIEDSLPMMDKLFVASQSTGIGIDTLSRQMVQFGAPLRQMGFDFDTSAALLSKFEKEGVNAELVMGSLRIALGKMAREGEPVEETFNRTIEAIKNAGSTSEANALALELFGARAGPDMAAAIREGRFAVDDLVAMMGESKGAILDTAESTADFGEKWTLFKNKALLALEPVSTKVLELATVAMVAVSDWFDKHGPTIEAFWNEKLLPALAGIAAFIQESVIPALQSLAAGFQEHVLPVIREGIEFIREQFGKFREYIDSDLRPAFENIKTAVTEVVEFIREHWAEIEAIIGPYLDQMVLVIKTAVEVVVLALGIIIDLLGGDFAGAWEKTKELIAAVWDLIVGTVTNGVEIVKGIMAAGWEAMKAAAQLAWDGIKALIDLAWQGIKDLVDTGIQGLKDGFNNLITFISELGGSAWNAAKSLGGNILDGLKNGISAVGGFASDIASAVGGAIKAFINTQIIDRINSALEFKISMPGPIPDVSVNPPDIPRLAKGGIVTRPTLALIGEAGPEAVIPLSRRGGAGNVGGAPSVTMNFYGPTDAKSLRRALDQWFDERMHREFTVGAMTYGMRPA